jgi:hypothetical protein
MRFQIFLRWITTAIFLVASLVLSGCGSGGTSSGATAANSTPGAGASSNSGSGSSSSPAALLTGLVHSGSKPIAGASVDLYVAGTSGYGVGAASLLSGAVTTDSDGKFSIASVNPCPSAKAQTYVVATGGDAGAGDNNSSVLMAALGNCSDLGSSAADVSEVSSVASVYALSQFMQPGATTVGASSTNVVGLVNAFATVNNLIDPSLGTARATTPAGNGTAPQTTLNALANIIAACVETNGGTACSQLFSLATPPGGTAPTDTLSALLNIALYPGNNVAQLSALQTSTKVFLPALAGAPSDWTLSIEYTGGGLNKPQLLAVDGAGDIWVPNAIDPGTLSVFSPTGEPLSGTTGFTGGGLSYPEAVAVDVSGNIWSANQGPLSDVSEHTASGNPLSGPNGYTAAGLVQPWDLALDAAGNVFTANSNSTGTKLSAAGTPLAQFLNGGLNLPYAVAVDSSQNVWLANYGSHGVGNTVSKFSNTGTPAALAGYTGAGMAGPFGIAIDATGNAWVGNFSVASLSELSSTGAPLSGSGYQTPAMVGAVAVDGSNTIWTANSDGSVSRFSASGATLSPATGYISADATAEVGIALDASGNVWTTDNYVNSIFEYIGAGAPTATPLQLAVKNKTIGQRP